MQINQQFSTLILALLFFSSCNSDSEPPAIEKINPQPLSKPEVFIDFEQNGLAQPVSIEVLENSQLSILDIKQQEILVFNNSGQLQQRFGGNGRGPGEFLRPKYTDISAKYINVIDTRLNQVNQFDYSGNFKQSYNYEQNPFTNTISILKNGKYFMASMGEKESLIKLIDTYSDTATYFGKAKGEANPPIRLEIARKTLADGEIPQIFKNQVTMEYGNQYLYVFLDAYSVLQKYSANGELLWEKELNLPINEKIFQHYVKQAREASKGVVPTLSYITSMKIVGNQVFLLWSSLENQPRKLVQVSENGRITDIYHLPRNMPKFYDFAIAPSQQKLYLSASQLGQVYQVDFKM